MDKKHSGKKSRNQGREGGREERTKEHKMTKSDRKMAKKGKDGVERTAENIFNIV